MAEKNHFAALLEIRGWNTDDVICALNNNGLSECVDVCRRKDITGDKLLELSEMQLKFWKPDLSLTNIRKLAVFIQDISKTPAKFTLCSMSSNSEDAWDTDFDDDEEEYCQKTANNIPGKILDQNLRHPDDYQANGKLSVQSLVNKSYNTQNNDNILSSVNGNRTCQSRNKVNIPPVFSPPCSTQNGSSLSSSRGNITKPPFLKTNGADEQFRNDASSEPKNTKPQIPSRPPSLHSLKTLPRNGVQSTLPKPPAFNKEGLVLREICDRLPLEPDIMDEYESIDDDIIQTQSNMNLKSQCNGLGGSSHSVQQNVSGSARRSPIPHKSGNDGDQQDVATPSSSLFRNQLHISKKINTISQQILKTDQNSAVENIKKSPIFPPSHIRKQEGTFQCSKNLPFVNQEKNENYHRTPVPLPLRNETRHEVSSAAALSLSQQKNSQKVNEEDFTTGNSITPRLSKEYDDNAFGGESDVNDKIEETPHEEIYEYIPEHESRKHSDLERCEYFDGYLLPKAPPTLPPKQQVTQNVKPSEKVNNSESNGASGTLRLFGPLKKNQQKGQEKSSQDGKKNNTLPMQRPCIPESPRPSASRPLPPPPPDGGMQRVVKTPLVQMPWYFNVDRARGEEILRNSEDGTFMIRPSTKTQNGLTLTLKYGKRPFNICVRLRPDGRFALGTVKPTEQTFSSVEELVNHYTSNELLLYSNGKQAGIVVLTSPPRKDP